MSEEKKYLKQLLDQAMKTYSDHNETVKRLTIHIENLWTEIDLKNERIYDLKYELDQAKDKLTNCEFEMRKRSEVSDAQFQKDLANTFKTERTDN